MSQFVRAHNHMKPLIMMSHHGSLQDMELGEACGCPHDVGWAACYSEIRWTNAEIMKGFMLPDNFPGYDVNDNPDVEPADGIGISEAEKARREAEGIENKVAEDGEAVIQ